MTALAYLVIPECNIENCNDLSPGFWQDLQWEFIANKVNGCTSTSPRIEYSNRSVRIPPFAAPVNTTDVLKQTDTSFVFGLLQAARPHVDIARMEGVWRDEQSVTLILHLQFPHLDSTTTRLTPSPKRLDTRLQLILLLLQSDWKRLPAIRETFSKSVPRKSAILPKAFNIKSVFESRSIYNRRQATPIDPLCSLPPEIMQRVTSWLAARDLDCLRTCNSVLRSRCSGIVPGLKLKLYHHQKVSLQWMRDREKPLTEAQAWKTEQHRAFTGGRTVLLQSADGSVCHQISTLTGEVLDSPGFRNVARGGLLCDDPGLGKTVTVLALILQTLGLQSPPRIVPKPIDLFALYWEDHTPEEFRQRQLLKLVNAFSNFIGKKEIRTIRSEIENGARDFVKFETLVKTHLHPEVQRLWLEEVQTFKLRQTNEARKSFRNSGSKPNSRLTQAVLEEGRDRLLSNLIPSASTLLVVPSVLLEHWKNQFSQHVDLAYVTTRRPLIYEYYSKCTQKSIARAEEKLASTHDGVVFFDMAGTKKLPSASFLAKFRIVVTTTKRFSAEYKRGSVEEEMNQSSEGLFNYRTLDGHKDAYTESCELLKVYWLRMIVDEGHSMGNSRVSSGIQFAAWVQSRSRWLMTGTPTKQSDGFLTQIQSLMGYLNHGFFSRRDDGETYWRKEIAKAWRDKDVAAYFRLDCLMQSIMKRHTKLDIAELPEPSFHRKFIDMSLPEVTSYNSFVVTVQNNILMTTMNGKTSGLQDSLLHKSQAKFARMTLESIRKVCTGYSGVIPTLNDKFYRETLYLADALNLPEKKRADIREFMYRAENDQLSTCSVCQIQLSTLILMSCCGELICSECMDSTTKTCYVCDDEFDVDELQRFQPGFVLAWKENLRNDKVASKGIQQLVDESRRLAVPDGAGVVPLIRPDHNERPTRRPVDCRECEYDRYRGDGKCIHCRTEHDFCNLMNPQSRCEVCYRVAEDCSEEISKTHYLIQRLLELHKRAASSGGVRPLKVIVFSQFRSALNVVGDGLLRRFGSGCVAEYFGKHRKPELKKFTEINSCFCLLLTKDGSEGLDLSFVTHIFFLEAIYDKSLQDQAVARAWRMGAAGQVQVETLVARNSVEQLMEEEDEADRKSDAEPRRDRNRPADLLRSLRLNTDYHFLSSRKSNPVRSVSTKRERFEDANRAASLNPKRVKFDLKRIV